MNESDGLRLGGAAVEILGGDHRWVWGSTDEATASGLRGDGPDVQAGTDGGRSDGNGDRIPA